MSRGARPSRILQNNDRRDITTVCLPVFRRTQSGQQHADVRGPGDGVTGHDRAAGGRRGRRAGAEARPAEGGAAPVQAGHARGAQAAVHQHEAPEERVQDHRRVVVAVRPERSHAGRRHRHRHRRRRRRRRRQRIYLLWAITYNYTHEYKSSSCHVQCDRFGGIS